MLPGKECESSENCHLRSCSSVTTLCLPRPGHPMVVLPVFQELFFSHVAVWESGLTLKVGRNCLNWNDLACLCPMGQVISIKESWTKILAHTQRLAVSLCWNGIYFFFWVKDLWNFMAKVGASKSPRLNFTSFRYSAVFLVPYFILMAASRKLFFWDIAECGWV